MSDLPPSSLPAGASGGTPDDLLQQGLTALQHHHYTDAVQCLSQLWQNRSASGAVRLKARIGLIKALRGDGQIADAIALVQPLTTHPQPKIRQWASNLLEQLTQSLPEPPPPETDLSGFQPLDSPASPPKPVSQAPSAPEPSDLSGFQPLHNQPGSPKAPPAPPSPTPASADAAPPPGTQVPSFEPTEPITTDTPAGNDLDHSNQALHSPATASLFHYERLNELSPLPAEDAALPTEARASASTSDSPTMPSGDPGETTELLQFQYAGRLSGPRSLPQSGQGHLTEWVVLGASAVGLFWLCRVLVQWLLDQIARFLDLFDFLPIPLGWRYEDHTFLVLFGLVGLLLASPWLLDGLLQFTAGLKPLTIQTLQKSHPEGCRLLRRVAQQRGWLLPRLRELPTDAPLIFSFGWLPRFNRIVISRGLLNQLDDQELATLIGYELSHVKAWTLPYMSLVALLLQGLHQGYWQAARWGDRQSDRPFIVLAALGSSLCYGLYWVVRKLHVPLSRVRVLSSDRQTVEWTGNPNALVRALVKLEHGLAKSITQTGYTPPLVESTDLLTPCGYEAAITPSSIFPNAAFLTALCWDIQNPYRHWLSINSSHPGLGERLKRLTAYALRWQLSPELPFPPASATARRRPPVTFWDYGLPFLRQISPFIGPIVGVLIAMLLWFLGGIFEPLGLQRVAWVYGDRSVLWGSLLLGLGMGIMVRINPYFPDITVVNRAPNPPLPALLSDPFALPTDSAPVRLEGTLLGRRGIANWLCQDFILKTPTGLLKLHFFSMLGPLGNLLTHPQHPTDWLGRSIEVQGWYRRGAIAWLDVDTFLQRGKVVAKAKHPIWSASLSLGFCGLGLLVLIRG